ncbi:xanthine dehydrogenase family protein molybdopterin-binding subunit [Aeromicrobium sp. YIM 150415]|uniref:xanthine dehydrogenase family protein molybdopterin-binding subunit n=1 Tax=Aeromicrobium sp. YIM 150415 TaxID=2803912 RepID=UPI0019624BF5|nr:xanthine dehydrogenase family protein molybdopterin-binding subunit [Aeromicrobium sp. YIM 150415]MBM9464514.1 xanthine dehydrogenase family protein molybdopterin-binding subunit [Aeromicrobium sp. YIM 150415]
MATSTEQGYIGQALPRVEDDRLLRGRGSYVDDLSADGAYEVAFLRSEQAHARIDRIDTGFARAMPGVVAVYDGRDLAEHLDPMVFGIARIIPESITRTGSVASRVHPMPALPADRLTYVGQPYVMVIAHSRYEAEDALEVIDVELTPLPALIDPEEAAARTDVLVEPDWDDNIAMSVDVGVGDVADAFERATVVVEETFRSHRYIGSPIETRGVLATIDPDDALTVRASTQVPHQLRDFLAGALDHPADKIRCLAPDVGGGFGVKGSIYPEDLLVPFAARRLRHGVKWIEDRSEHLAATTHGREQVHHIQLAADADGRLLGVRDRIVHNCGAFHTLGLVVPYNSIAHLLGPYVVPNAEISLRAVVTNTGVVAPYRGAGRPEAVFAMERAMDRLARGLDLDPAELRRRNLIGPEQMPYTTGLIYRDGHPQVYDSGDYPELLAQARALVDEDEARSRQTDRRRVGIGYAAYIEGTGVGPFEAAAVSAGPDGVIRVATGAASQGQSHRTTFAQIAADAIGVDISSVEVVGGDTAAIATGFGTIASRSLVVAGNAAARAGRELRGQILELAGHLLEADPADLELDRGEVTVRGTDHRAGVGEVLALLSPFHPRRPSGLGPRMHVESAHVPGPVTYAAGVHVAVVEVDTVTGAIDLRRFVIAHDCGRIVNPIVVEGQILGGVMQGIGGALYEELAYDDQGQLTTGSFLDYLIPTASEAPVDVRIAHVDTPSSLNGLGVKGLGEGGAIGPPAAIANAVEDALGDLGVVVRQCPLTPSRVLGLLAEAGTATSEEDGLAS